jgi:glucan phosphoethanolaminetransferase (alkaline phosphatase superfamily)
MSLLHKYVDRMYPDKVDISFSVVYLIDFFALIVLLLFIFSGFLMWFQIIPLHIVGTLSIIGFCIVLVMYLISLYLAKERYILKLPIARNIIILEFEEKYVLYFKRFGSYWAFIGDDAKIEVFSSKEQALQAYLLYIDTATNKEIPLQVQYKQAIHMQYESSGKKKIVFV